MSALVSNEMGTAPARKCTAVTNVHTEDNNSASSYNTDQNAATNEDHVECVPETDLTVNAVLCKTGWRMILVKTGFNVLASG
jgi:hypothetical protein